MENLCYFLKDKVTLEVEPRYSRVTYQTQGEQSTVNFPQSKNQRIMYIIRHWGNVHYNAANQLWLSSQEISSEVILILMIVSSGE